MHYDKLAIVSEPNDFPEEFPDLVPHIRYQFPEHADKLLQWIMD